ncbi:hypothetical protein DDB_G0272380 [Dictyostelium discoideum AX4]|uniref:phytol kinase n=1 Tax=Dictyostelium discoideum TaxID=44689 RepID=Q55A10_DICDI|nr:hypothetical protein DDB_G0272380 [Dictyostelium discoideum AX4]EAL71342.1 hypothetical protein DDB_G0272380 [Dictyostelium discoideum AX4]|eukprot:XP_645174.1 hypothetical protein DDB_G0272380 [Dictyostelium discoideum AX4]
MNELIAPFLTLSMICLMWLNFCQFLKKHKVISSTGIIYVLVWRIFPQFNWYSRIVVGLVPLIISFQYALIGLGIINDQKTVESMSRSGSPRELLLGPLSYGIIISLLTMIFWFSPISIITIGVLCLGDGFAAIFGLKYGTKRIPYNREKTLIGSLAFFICSFIGTFILLTLLQDRLLYPSIVLAPSLFWVCLISTLIESLPLRDWDNITISICSVLTLNLMGY